MKARIRQNVYGNWRGYIGTRCVREFGAYERGAQDWLAAMQNDNTAGIKLLAEQAYEDPARMQKRLADYRAEWSAARALK